MNIKRSISRRILLWSLLIMLLMGILFIAAGYYGGHFFLTALPISVLQDASSQSISLQDGLKKVLPVLEILRNLYIPVVCCGFLFAAILLWVLLRTSISRLIQKSPVKDQLLSAPAKKKSKDQPFPDLSPETLISRKEINESNKRFYLQMLTVLQREGRLIDFFAEDLSIYEDDQIGAAVRSIQENCKNSLKKYLNPKAVIEQNEGDPITVPDGFDPNAIKLTGNVIGEPPFHGTLRHKGWRASRLELPTLSAVKDPSIIAPAEVEII